MARYFLRFLRLTFFCEKRKLGMHTLTVRTNHHNDEGEIVSDETTYAVTAAELRQFIERYEQLDAEKKDLSEAQKEVLAEAKGCGYDTAAMRKVIALRKRNKDDVAEEEAIIEIYKSALGMN